LSYNLFDKIYNRLARWKSYYDKQSEGVEEDYRNINTLFLLVYAKDLITSLSHDRTTSKNLRKRIYAAGAAVGHAVLRTQARQLTNSVLKKCFANCEIAQTGISIQIRGITVA